MPVSNARFALSLSLQYMALFWILGLSLAFLPPWLEAKGLNSVQIGSILGLAFWAKIPFNLSLAQIADRRGNQNVIVLVIATTILLLLPVMHFATGYYTLLVIWGVCGALVASAIPLSDSLGLIAWNAGKLDYGRIRLWGSIGFVLAAVGGGWLLDWLGKSMLMLLFIGGALMLMIAAGWLPPAAASASQTRRPFAIAYLLRNSQFRNFIITCSLLQCSHTLLYGFASIHWQNAGIAKSTIGLLWAAGVLTEILLFAFGGRIAASLGWHRLLIIAGIGGIVRWTGMFLTTELVYLWMLQLLHGATFACTHLACIIYVAGNVDRHLAATAQALYDGSAMGIVFGLFMALAGSLYAHWQGDAFLAMALLSVTALLFIRLSGLRTACK